MRRSRLLRSVVLALSSATLVALPDAASADTAVMLPSANDRAVPEAVRVHAADAVAAALAADGATVISAVDARSRMLAQPFRDCAQVDCAEQVVRGIGADFAVVVTVWPMAGTSAPRSLAVTLVAADGSQSAGEARLAEGGADLEQAAQTASRAARQRQRLGAQGVLVVRTVPDGARVTLDDQPLGVTPVRHIVAPGGHHLVVRYGDDSLTRDVTITSNEEAIVEHVFTEHGERPLGHRPVLGPALLGLAGVALVALDVGVALSLECKERFTSGACRRDEQIAPVPFAAVAITGGAAIVGALLWYFLGTTDDTAVTPSRSGLGVSVRF